MSQLANNEALDALVSIANDYLSYRSNLITDGQDELYLDYLTSYGYGEISLREAVRDSRLPDEVKDSILRRGSEDAVRQHVEPYLTTNVIGIYIDEAELISLTVGEVEVELPEDFVAGWTKLTPAERAYVARHLEAYVDAAGDGCFAYLDHNYDRYVLVLDVEAYENDYPTTPHPDDIALFESALGKIAALSREIAKLRNAQSPFVEADEIRARAERTELRCIGGAGLEAVDLMHYRISKRLISKRSSAKLRLIK